MHLEAREAGNDQDLVDLNIDPSSITFPPNKYVTEWSPIGEAFRDLHTGVAVVRWTENEVLTRYRFRANRQKDGSSTPSLLVEALVLDAATGTWSAMGAPKKQLLSATASMAIKIASLELAWYSPIPAFRLTTAMGFTRSSMEVSNPSEIKYRWIIQAAMAASEAGKSIHTLEEYETYMRMAVPCSAVNTTEVAFALPYPFKELDPVPSSQGRTVVFRRGMKGKVIHRPNPVKPTPTPTHPGKYNTKPKGPKLESSVLPQDAPRHLRELAEKLFNASVASSTAKKYSSTEKYMTLLESEMGRKFSFPLSAPDYSLVLTSLAARGLSTGTIRSYLAGARRMSIARGAEPSPTPELAKQLLKGYDNVRRDPRAAVLTSTHRPITIPVLRLLGHAANTHWKGDSFDMLSFWVVCLVSFWGALRIGEVLGKSTTSFSPKSDLLGSDVLHLSSTSFAWWIRDPKVTKQFGDVVEIWSVPAFPDIDPFKAFSTFWRLRAEKGFPLSSPLFMRSGGDILTATHFNRCLQSLLNHYAVELDLASNSWTGHSFRAGLPTLLQSLGFSDEQIKVWGRWASSVFQTYAKDMDRRMQVQRGILDVIHMIKAKVDGTPIPPTSTS